MDPNQRATKPQNAYQGLGLARFMELRGRRITEAAGVLWHSVEGRMAMSMPYQLTVDADPRDLNKMLISTGSLGVRFPSRTRAGLASGVYICRRRDYSIPTVDIRQRSRVRRGLERCEVRAARIDEMMQQGLQLNQDTMRRQGRWDSEFGEPKQWKRLVDAISNSPGVVPMGAFVDGRLAAYMITLRDDNWLHILHQNSRQELLEHHPNHALTYTMTLNSMRDTTLEAVCYGLVPIVPGDGLHEYKLRLGYEVIPHASAIQLHPAVGPVLTSGAVLKAAQAVCRRRPSDQRLQRFATVLEGARMTRFESSNDNGTMPEAAIRGEAM